LIEPHTLDKGGVLDQTQQCRLRRHEALPGFILCQSIEAVVKRRPVLIDQLVKAASKL
jgi:hypothetical protein